MYTFGEWTKMAETNGLTILDGNMELMFDLLFQIDLISALKSVEFFDGDITFMDLLTMS